MEHYIRNEAEMSQDAPNHTKNKTRKLPVPHRTRLTPAAREEQIINVAAAHFARRGVVGASMLDIAKEAGITRALLYHYFPGKESLAAAVTRREARAVLEPSVSITKTRRRRCIQRYTSTLTVWPGAAPKPPATFPTPRMNTSNGCCTAPACP